MYGHGKVSPASGNENSFDDHEHQRPYFIIFAQFCETTTAHGFKWCLRLKPGVARRTLIAILFLFTALSPLSLITNFVDYMAETTVNENMAFKTAKRIRYPNITVCNRKYFSKRRLNGMNCKTNFRKRRVYDASATPFKNSTLAMTWPTT